MTRRMESRAISALLCMAALAVVYVGYEVGKWWGWW